MGAAHSTPKHEWKRVSPSGSIPKPVSACALACAGDYLFKFGGFTGTGGTNTFHAYNIGACVTNNIDKIDRWYLNLTSYRASIT